MSSIIEDTVPETLIDKFIVTKCVILKCHSQDLGSGENGESTLFCALHLNTGETWTECVDQLLEDFEK